MASKPNPLTGAPTGLVIPAGLTVRGIVAVLRDSACDIMDMAHAHDAVEAVADNELLTFILYRINENAVIEYNRQLSEQRRVDQWKR